MCGFFGLELNPVDLSQEERAAIPSILSDWEEINPIVISGAFYRLAWPGDTNWPAVQFVAQDGTSVVFAFQQMATVKPAPSKVWMLRRGTRVTCSTERIVARRL